MEIHRHFLGCVTLSNLLNFSETLQLTDGTNNDTSWDHCERWVFAQCLLQNKHPKKWKLLLILFIPLHVVQCSMCRSCCYKP